MKFIILKNTLIIFLLFFMEILYSQNYQIHLAINPLNYKFNTNLDSVGITRELKKMIHFYHLNGYIESNIDSIHWDNKTAHPFIHFGHKYSIMYKYNPSDSLQDVNSKFNFQNTSLDSQQIILQIKKVLNELENNGYPFAIFKIDSVIQTNEKLILNYSLNKEQYFVYDSLHKDGNVQVKKKFLEAVTGMKEGKPYNEKEFLKAQSRLNQLPFLYSERAPIMAFMTGGKARPYYVLNKRKSDQVNALIGLAPSSGNNKQNVVFTGEFLLKLNHLFQSGKQFSLNWRSFQARSQDLKSHVNLPYLMNRPIGINAAIELIKYDTIFTTFQRQIGFQYYTSGINGLSFFYQVHSTNLNTIDTQKIRNTKQFPITNAMLNKQYGIAFNFNFLDQLFNPRKGWQLEGAFSAGRKEILKETAIEKIKFYDGNQYYTLYDSNQLVFNQFRLKFQGDVFFPIFQKSTIKLGIKAEHLIAPTIYFNETIRTGGINSLKGFNEQSIFATNFNLLELEYRYILGQNSFVRAFWNGAYYEDRTINQNGLITDTPWGFGVGANIETKAGILNIIYALGKEKNNSFDFRTGKIHFGISSYF